MVHVSGGRGFAWGFRGGLGDLGSGLSQPGGKSCWAVWWSGLWCPGTVFLMVGAGTDCGRGGWGPSRCCWFCWSIVQGKCPGWMGEGHRSSLQLCSLSAVGSCGLLPYSSRTRQWFNWSAHSQWCPCRMCWGWVDWWIYNIFSFQNFLDFLFIYFLSNWPSIILCKHVHSLG